MATDPCPYPRSGEQRKRIVRVLMEHPDWSNLEVGREVGSGRQYVGKVRRQLEKRGRIERQAFITGPTGYTTCRVAPGPEGKYLRRQLSNLRWLAKAVRRKDWRQAAPELRREFWSLTEALLDRLSRSIDPATGEMLNGGIPRRPRPGPRRDGHAAECDRSRPG